MQEEERISGDYVHLLQRLSYFNPDNQDMCASRGIIRAEIESLEVRAQRLLVESNAGAIPSVGKSEPIDVILERYYVKPPIYTNARSEMMKKARELGILDAVEKPKEISTADILYELAWGLRKHAVPFSTFATVAEEMEDEKAHPLEKFRVYLAAGMIEAVKITAYAAALYYLFTGESPFNLVFPAHSVAAQPIEPPEALL